MNCIRNRYFFVNGLKSDGIKSFYYSLNFLLFRRNLSAYEYIYVYTQNILYLRVRIFWKSQVIFFGIF